MRVDFYELQKSITGYISAHYPKEAKDLYNLEPLDKTIMGFPDIDRERKNKIAYFDFDQYSLERLTLESELLTGYADIYITLRSSAPAQTMTEEAAKYTTAFFSCVENDKTLGASVDEANIESIEFFEHAEANAQYKAVKLRLKFQKEY